MLQRPKRWVESLRLVHYVFYRSNGTLACGGATAKVYSSPRVWLAIPGMIWISHGMNRCCGEPVPRLGLEGHVNIDTRRLTAQSALRIAAHDCS